jgi:hypothetical protein
MVDPNSRAFKIGKKIGHLAMTHVTICLIIKRAKIVAKLTRTLIALSPIPNP